GMRARATVVKNKIAPPFRKTEFDILFNEGISYLGDLVDLATTHNVLEKSGTWFSYGALRLGQGRDKAIEFLRASPDVVAKIDAQLREAIAAAGRPAATKDVAAAKEAAAKDVATKDGIRDASKDGGRPPVAGAAAATATANGPGAPAAAAARPAAPAPSKDGEARKPAPTGARR